MSEVENPTLSETAPKVVEEPASESDKEDEEAEPAGGRKSSRTPRKVEAFRVEVKEVKEFVILQGPGVRLGDIENIEHLISSSRDVGPGSVIMDFHRLLYNRPGKQAKIRANLRDFSGFVYTENKEKERAAYQEKLNNWTIAKLKELLTILDLERSGTRAELAERAFNFLEKPEDQGKRSIVAAKKKKTEKRKRDADKKSSKSSSKKDKTKSKKSDDKKKKEKAKAAPKGKSDADADSDGDSSSSESSASDSESASEPPAKKAKVSGGPVDISERDSSGLPTDAVIAHLIGQIPKDELDAMSPKDVRAKLEGTLGMDLTEKKQSIKEVMLSMADL